MKHTGTIVFLFWAVTAGIAAVAQPVQQEVASLRLALENDFFMIPSRSTDRYYTNGARIEYFFTKERVRFPSRLLISISSDKNVFSWGVAQYMFTPSRIDSAEIQWGDRPYAGALFAVHSLHSTDYQHKMRLSSELFLGVMGPASFAEQTQKWVHERINSTRPQGWDHQVPNDIILNYNIQAEKQLLFVPSKIQVSGLIQTFNGTLYNAMDAGFTMRVGRFRNYLQATVGSSDKQLQKGYQLYVFIKPVVRVVYSNALLQGGIINSIRKSGKGYTLHKDQLERINAFYEAGLIYQRNSFGIVVMQKLRTAEFKGGAAQEVGNITLNFKI